MVLTGIARECTATLSFAPGDREATVLSLVTQDGTLLDTSRWARLAHPSLEGVGEAYTGALDLSSLALRGHFTSPNLPWEALRILQSERQTVPF